MDPLVVYIGGPSGAGKSRAKNKLLERVDLPVVALDDLHKLISDSGICREPETPQILTGGIGSEMLKILIEKGYRCVVEGTYIDPESIALLFKQNRKIFFPCYLGYPNADVEKLYLRMYDEEKQHHIITSHLKGERDAFEELEFQKSTSSTTKNECLRLGMPFVDNSDWENGDIDLIEFFNTIPI